MGRVYLSPDKEKIVAAFPDFDPVVVGLMRRVPGMRFDKPTKTWRGPVTKPTALALWRAVHRRVNWAQEVTDAIKAIPPPKMASEIELPDVLRGKLQLPTGAPQPFEFQKIGIAFAMQNKRVLIADDVGAGKSGQAILAAELSKCQSILIVCPKFLITNWDVELEKWTSARALLITAGSEEIEFSKREFEEELLDRRYCIINYDILDKFKPIFDRKWDCVIGDEIHAIKNKSSLRSRRFRRLKADHTFLLSGTPFLNRPVELFPILDYLSQGGFGDFYEFADLYGGPGVVEIPMGVFCPQCSVRRKTIKGTCFSCGTGTDAERKFRTAKTYNGASNLDDLKRRLAPLMIARKKSEVLSELPDYQRIDRLIELPKASREKYDAAVNNLISYLMKFRRRKLEDAVRSAFNEAMRRGGELRQILSEAKVEIAANEMRQLLAGGERVIAFTCYKATAESLAEALRGGGEDEDARFKAIVHTGDYSSDKRAKAIAEFKETPGSALICTVQSAGIGLNLTEARYGFFLDLPWTPAEVFQAEGRLHRITQKQEVSYIRYFAAGTYDEAVMRKLKEKQVAFDHLIGKSEDVKIEADFVIDNLFASFVRDTIEGLKLRPADANEEPEEHDSEAAG